jgi:hypothetical protein
LAKNGGSPARDRKSLRPCFDPEEEEGHDSRGRKATLSINLEMIQNFQVLSGVGKSGQSSKAGAHDGLLPGNKGVFFLFCFPDKILQSKIINPRRNRFFCQWVFQSLNLYS